MATKGQKLLAAGTAFLASEPVILAVSHAPGLTGVGVIAGLAVGAVAYNAVDDIERAVGKEIPPLPIPQPKLATPEQPSLVYRMFNGKSVRGNPADMIQESATQRQLSVSQDLSKVRSNIVAPGGGKANVDTEPIATVSAQTKKSVIPPGGYKPLDQVSPSQVELSLDPRFPVPQDMAQIIEKGFKPNRNGILLANTTEGYKTEAIGKLHHVGLGGLSGGGKTNLTRLITSQLLACNAKVYMINPNFAPVKHNGQRLEDWRPIAARLQMPVARTFPEMVALLNYFMKIFEERRNREQLTPKRGSDIFLVLGEWPVIVEEYPDAVKVISRLLRQSRQYGIHVVAEFQDALIKTIGGSSGTRANYGTAFFFGGDVTTAKTLLNLPDGTKIDNTGLGKEGAVYLRSFSSKAIPGRVPFFSNKALYMLLGFPEDPVTDELVDEDEFYEEDEDIDAIFAKMPDIRSEDEDIEDDEEYPFSPSRDISGQPETSKPLVPIVPDKGRKAEDIDMNTAIKVWNNMHPSIRDLEEIFDLTNHQAQKLRKMILARADAQPEAMAN
jgi:hypothetical protein